MTRAPRIDTKRLDLAGFEAWLRDQLQGSALSAVLVVIVQVVRALFEQNTQLRQRILGRRPKPPSERLAAIERQIAFKFQVPSNDVQPDAIQSADSPRANAEQADPKKGKRGVRGVRRPLPPTIGTIIVTNDVPAERRTCTDCACEMATVSHREVRQWELIPGRIVQQVRRDETVACPRCDAIVSAKAPCGLLDGGTLGPTLVTDALAEKILNAMPIERQARDYQRQGIPLSASTLGRSVAAMLDELVPLADRITLRMKQADRVQFDGSGLRVLDATAVAGTRRDTLWVIVGDSRWVRFAALESGDSNAIEEFMRGADAESFQCDGTSVTNFVEKKWKRCRPGCHSHGRRRLAEAVRRGDLRALEALRLYKRLFKIERDAGKQKLGPDARKALRQVASAPLLEELRAWVLDLAPSVEPKSALGEALTYLQRQWMRLCLFMLDGNIELTNNRSERELRPWVLGQHAWLFVADQNNADRWAAGFSIVHTAIAHGVNPRAYLHAVVAKLIARHPHQRLDELLPDAMLRSHPEIADPLNHAVAALSDGSVVADAEAA
jgi:transposase